MSRGKFASANQKHCPDLGSDASSAVWNFCARFSDVISRGNQWQHREISAVFSGKSHSAISYRAFSHDVTAAILVFQNNETAAMLVYSRLKFSGTNQKPERRRPFGTSLVRHCPQGLFSPFFTFLRAISGS